MIYRLTKEIVFPNPKNGEESGLLAVGGDLSEERLLLAYSHGIFPWYAFREPPIKWYCPLKRFVIFPEKIHISHSTKSLLRKNKYTFSFNKQFNDVILFCALHRIEDYGAWLGMEMIEAYTNLHKKGYVKSVEVWEEDKLVGGLYGVMIGRCFCGESMFSRVPSASKLALIALSSMLQETGQKFIIDCQFRTPHLESMGGEYISYNDYMEYLQ